MQLKLVVAAGLMSLSLFGINSQAATVSTDNTSGFSQENLDLLNNSSDFKKLPQEILLYLKDVGGSLSYQDKVVVNGSEVYGVYTRGGDHNNEIKVSGKTFRDGFPNMFSTYVLHEIGHFVYFNADISDEDKTIIKGIFDRFDTGIIATNSMEEEFASSFADYFTTGGYYLSDVERQMFKRVTQNIMDKYYNNHPDIERKEFAGIERVVYY